MKKNLAQESLITTNHDFKLNSKNNQFNLC